MTSRVLMLLAFAIFATTGFAAEPGDMKPGLVATYSDGAKSVLRLEPTAAITLGTGQSPHPRLHHATTIEWKGQINVVRPGKYAFAATVQNGSLQVQVNGKPVLSATAKQNPQTQASEEVTLAGGVQSFQATFKTDVANQAMRVELRWQGPGFRDEPLPHQVLGISSMTARPNSPRTCNWNGAASPSRNWRASAATNRAGRTRWPRGSPTPRPEPHRCCQASLCRLARRLARRPRQASAAHDHAQPLRRG